MIIKDITQVGNPIIRKKSSAVKEIKGKRTQRIIKNLIDTMRSGQLVGMAAPQIGINSNIFVTEIRQTDLRKIDKKKDADPLRVFINPRLISTSKKMWSRYEGCGSVAHAHLFGKVNRPVSLTITAKDSKGERFELTAKGLLARVILHELDHLHGKVFLDRMTSAESFMSRDEYRKKYVSK